MKNSFELNPMDKIKNIQDVDVRNICFAAVEEAQNNIHQSRAIAVERVFNITAHKLPSILRGE